VLLGILSFVVFCVLATVISLGMGIFEGDLAIVFAYPDIRPDPDVIGWGYFLLSLVPGIWEELAFRGLIQSKLREVFSSTLSVLLSAVFFGLFHFSNIVTQAPSQVIFGVIMAFFFGIGWGFMTVRARSVIPAMISHYLVDSTGKIFLSVDSSNPALVTGFFVLYSARAWFAFLRARPSTVPHPVNGAFQPDLSGVTVARRLIAVRRVLQKRNL
jgi:membrane protease YdiL (CAAX protease family)